MYNVVFDGLVELSRKERKNARHKEFVENAVLQYFKRRVEESGLDLLEYFNSHDYESIKDEYFKAYKAYSKFMSEVGGIDVSFGDEVFAIMEHVTEDIKRTAVEDEYRKVGSA